jgi:predicted phage terminase large subunit-like protein
MDTDGFAAKNGCVEFYSSKEILIQGVSHLLHTLGIKHEIRVKKIPKGQPHLKESYRIKFVAPFIVFRFSAKASRQNTTLRNTQKWRYVVNIQEVESEPVKCIAVDAPDHLFLAGEGHIPTHNSSALLMAALQYVDYPQYDALILRKTFADLSKPNAIMDRALAWLRPFVDRGEVKWNSGQKRFFFPSGATLSFGYLDHSGDHYQYQGAEFQFIAFDEVTQFPEYQYAYLFSRLRKNDGNPVPLRMRAAGNPGGVGHDWVKQRFLVEGKANKRVFVPARLWDNPHINQAEYEKSLMNLDPVTRAQLLNGDWDAQMTGGFFKRQWFKPISQQEVPDRSDMKLVRYWDLAATEPSEINRDPDYTVGVLVGKHLRTKQKYVLDVKRFRLTPKAVEDQILETAKADGRKVSIRMEQEGGASGKNTIDHYRLDVLNGYDFKGVKPTLDKVARAIPVANSAEAGDYHVVQAVWTTEFINEVIQFPAKGVHDDQVDGFSGADEALENNKLIRTPVRAVGLYGSN